MSRFARKKEDLGSYSVRHDSMTVKTNNVELTVNCPRGLDLDMAKKLINQAAELELELSKDVVGGKAFTSGALPIHRDSSLPSNVIEFRDETGKVVGRIVNVGRISPKLNDEDDDEEG